MSKYDKKNYLQIKTDARKCIEEYAQYIGKKCMDALNRTHAVIKSNGVNNKFV